MYLQAKMIGLTFKNPVPAGYASITEWVRPVDRWLKAGAEGILAKTITTDPKLSRSIRPTFYALTKHGLKGVMVEAELLSHYEPGVWAKEVAPRFKEPCEQYDARWIQSIVGRGIDLDDWARPAEAAGAEAIELDLGCPPIGVKLSPTAAGLLGVLQGREGLYRRALRPAEVHGCARLPRIEDFRGKMLSKVRNRVVRSGKGTLVAEDRVVGELQECGRLRE